MNSNKILKNSIGTFLYVLSKTIINFLLVRIMIVSYGSELNGYRSTILSILNYLNIIEAGVGAATLFKLYAPMKNKDYEKANMVLAYTNQYFKKISLYMSIILIGVAIIYPSFISEYNDKLLGTYIVVIYGIITVSEYIFDGKFSILLNADNKLYITKYITLISYMICNIIVIILAYYRYNIYVVLTMLLIEVIFRVSLTIYYMKKNYKWIDLKVEPDESVHKMSRDVLIQKISSLIFNTTDILLISSFVGLLQASVYSVYNMILMGLSNFMSVIVDAPVSIFGHIFSDKTTEASIEAYETYEHLTIIMATIVSSCWIILIIPFIQIYTKGITDVEYVNLSLGIIMGIYFIVKYFRTTAATLMNAKGRFKIAKKIYFLEMMINLVLSLILVFWLGTFGVVLGSVIALLISTYQIVKNIYNKILEKKILNFYKKSIINIVVFIIISFIGYYIVSLLNINNYVQLIICGGITFIICGLLVFVINFIIWKDNILNITKRFINIVKKRTI